MITIKNYYKSISDLNLKRPALSPVLQKGWDFINQVTQKGANFSTYTKSEPIKRTIDLYIEKLNQFVEKKNLKVTQKKSVSTAKLKAESKKSAVRPTSTKTKPRVQTRFVEAIAEELKFIKRYINLHEKAKTKNQIRLFLAALQKAIREKRIKKSSSFAKHIIDIQDSLIKLMEQFKNEQIIQVSINAKKRAELLSIIGRQTQLLSVKYIKDYILLQGKPISTKKATSLHNRIARKINAGSINEKDKYWSELKQVLKHLHVFIKTNPVGGELQVEKKTLNGYNDIVDGRNGIVIDDNSRLQEDVIMNSMDVMKLSFEKLGFKGKWLDLIGNPSKDFTAMIYGKPKMGKSYLSVDFAGYLARNHGTVLYVAKEEGIDDTLKEKLKDTSVAHPDLDVSNYLPENLDRYDFVFLDSVTKLGLRPDDLEKLKQDHPSKAFIYIFQSTKQGNFRGNNEFQHDVDVVIEIPEKGRAVQYGRFNQGGELDIFG